MRNRHVIPIEFAIHPAKAAHFRKAKAARDAKLIAQLKSARASNAEFRERVQFLERRLERRVDRCLEQAKRAPDAWTSAVRAAVSTLGVVDRDRDLIMPGSLVNGPGELAMVSSWGHAAMKGEQPVGAARLEEHGDRLIALVSFDDTLRGRETCKRVERERPDWSLGFDPSADDFKWRRPTEAEAARGALRVILRWRVFEVSPVDKGAGVSTGTHTVCCGSCAAEMAELGLLPPAEDVDSSLYSPKAKYMAAALAPLGWPGTETSCGCSGGSSCGCSD